MEYLQFVLAPQMINGLAFGVALVLMALGLTIIFGLLDVINMSHGEFYAMGAFASVSFAAMGLGFWTLCLLVPIVLLVIGFLVERTLIQTVFHHRDRHILTLLLTFGLALILEEVFQILYGPNPIRPALPVTGGTELFEIYMPNYRLVLIGLGVAIIVGVWTLVYRTSLGAMVRAAAFDKDMAGSLGVPVKLIYSGTFAFGCALAGLAGVLLAPIYSVFPTMGRDFILLAFTVVIVGGMGSIRGAVFAGIILTQIQAVSSLYVSPVWAEPIVFTIMVAVLVFRPQGLFGKLGNA